MPMLEVRGSTHPFADLAELIAGDGAYRRYAHGVAAVWRDLLTPLRDDPSSPRAEVHG